jgi:uncharacterized protein (TIGR02145 family)
MFGKPDKSGNANTHKFVYLPVTNPITGRTWLNNNLGAEYADSTNPKGNFKPTQQAKSSTDHKAYGSLFQWGRKADGHELINWTNGKTGVGVYGTTTERVDNPEHGDFITEYSSVNDWRLHQNDTLWKNEESENNVCPIGYRLPTAGDNWKNKEWEIEVNSWHTDYRHNSTTSAHALASTLKLPLPNFRSGGNGVIYRDSIHGQYWSSSVSSISGRLLTFRSGGVLPNTSYNRSHAFAVRCIKN